MVIKKLIAISVVFALVAGAAFAVDLGGTVFGTVDVLAKPATGDATLFSSGAQGRVRLEGSGEEEIGIGTIGGWIRLDASGGGVDIANIASALAWWQPIEQLRIQIGNNPDGHFDASHITRYGFYAQANEIGGLVTSDGNWGSTCSDDAIFGGYNALHFALIITPMDGVSINVAIPLNASGAFAGGYTGTITADKQIAAAFKGALFQVNYAADFGSIHVTYAGAGSTEKYDADWDSDPDTDSIGPTSEMGSFFASAYLGSLVENLGLEIGLKFTIPANDAPKKPLAIGLGATYSTDQFGVKLRGIFQIPMEDGEKVAIRVDLLPYYAVNDNVTAYMDAGIYLPNSKNFIWHFAPYVRVGSEWGAGFYAGLRFTNADAYSATKYASGVKVTLPIGFIAKF